MQHWEIIDAGNVKVPSTPKEIWQAAVRYFIWSDGNPLEISQPVLAGKAAGQELKRKIERPYSIKAFCIHCGILEEYLRDIQSSKDNESDYVHVVKRIFYIIEVQNMELAIADVYNPVIISKLYSIDKPVEIEKPIVITFKRELPELANSEAEIDLEKDDRYLNPPVTTSD